ncbi:MAG: large subunit ribosomal protein [Chthoniobacter sp.]|jgi:large subunit ribosomal protein L22|nr:large subunit ribosomal protein [Chthoniobacter sp.]
MQIKSIYRGARISAFKCREVAREIQGLPVAAALDILAFTPRKAAVLIAKTLKSAIANAENNNNLRADKLVVQEATVGEGPTLKRFQPKARGSAGPIRKRSSHIRIILTDEIEIKPKRQAKKSPGKKKSARPTARKKVSAPAPAAVEKPAPAPAPEPPSAATPSPAPESATPATTATTQE